MRNLKSIRTFLAVVILITGPLTILAQDKDAELEKLKAKVQAMEQMIQDMKSKIDDLEKAKAVPPPPPVPANVTAQSALLSNSPSMQFMEKVAAGKDLGVPSQIQDRQALNNQQDGVPRPKDYTLDPTYRGFVPIPNTPVLIKFNAKPRVDVTADNKNTGDNFRFVPAKFPLQGEAGYGGTEQAYVNANGSQLRLDVRAPEMAGNLRFYYQNDFFGSDTSNMKYRLQQLYGQFFGVTAGFTYGVFEDPDAVWPDTVDYEGPNAAIFARRPVVHYTYAFNEHWNVTFGVEQPDIYLDTSSSSDSTTQLHTVMPDLGFNVRWERAGVGHVQFSSIFREIGSQGQSSGTQNVFGYGVNLCAAFNLTQKDFVQGALVVGKGCGGMGNDTSFLNSDGAFSTSDQLEALGYWSAMIGYTHNWNDVFRSTISYGHVQLNNASGQVSTFYHLSNYASANLVWQIRKRLSVGLEGLYGNQQGFGGAGSGNIYRVQLGLVYSLFD